MPSSIIFVQLSLTLFIYLPHSFYQITISTLFVLNSIIPSNLYIPYLYQVIICIILININSIITAMKKYSSYVDLKLHPSLNYNLKGPTLNPYHTNNPNAKLSSTPKSPSFKKAILYDNPILTISKDNIYTGSATPTSVKYSGGYKKKYSINQKQKLQKAQKAQKTGKSQNNSRKQNVDVINKDLPNYTNKGIQKIPSSYNIPKAKTNTIKNSEPKRNSDSKSKKRESRQKLGNNNNCRDKPMKISELDIKSYLQNKAARLDVQSPKSTDLLFKNTQKEKDEKIKNKLKEKKSSSRYIRQEKKPNKAEEELDQYITKYQMDTKPLLLHCTSQTSLLPNHLRPLSSACNTQNLKSRYYIQSLYSAFFGNTANCPNKLSTFQQICKNHLQTSIEFMSYAKKNKSVLIPSAPHTTLDLQSPRNRPRNTIIFDLDETLIHCNESLDLPHDIEIEIVFPNNTTIKAGINVRQYAVECLKQLSQQFQIIIFTASHQCYANKIIDYLDPQNRYVSHRLFRQHCYKTKQGFYVKDLRILSKCRSLDNLLLIDNAAYSYCFQPSNGVPIIPFYNNKTDLQLRQIVKYLKQLQQEGNRRCLRQVNQEFMKLSQYHKYRDCKQLINQLYL